MTSEAHDPPFVFITHGNWLGLLLVFVILASSLQTIQDRHFLSSYTTAGAELKTKIIAWLKATFNVDATKYWDSFVGKLNISAMAASILHSAADFFLSVFLMYLFLFFILLTPLTRSVPMSLQDKIGKAMSNYILIKTMLSAG